MVLSELVELGPCIPAETVKACALIGLHMMAEETALRLDGDSCPKLRDMWRYGCPKNTVWSSVGDEWAGSEGTSSFEDYEHNVDNLALEVVGLELPHGNGHFMPRNEGCVLSELKFAELTSFAVFTEPEQLSFWNCHNKETFSLNMDGL